VKFNRRFGETYTLHSQDRRVSQSQLAARWLQQAELAANFLLHAGFLLDFDPENGGDIFL
jgi:hypothetical protein